MFFSYDCEDVQREKWVFVAQHAIFLTRKREVIQLDDL